MNMKFMRLQLLSRMEYYSMHFAWQMVRKFLEKFQLMAEL